MCHCYGHGLLKHSSKSEVTNYLLQNGNKEFIFETVSSVMTIISKASPAVVTSTVVVVTVVGVSVVDVVVSGVVVVVSTGVGVVVVVSGRASGVVVDGIVVVGI